MKKLLFFLILAAFTIPQVNAKGIGGKVETQGSATWNAGTFNEAPQPGIKNDEAPGTLTTKEDAAPANRADEEALKDVCFVYLQDYYFTEAMDGTVYLNLEFEVHCYASKTNLTFFIDNTQ